MKLQETDTLHLLNLNVQSIDGLFLRSYAVLIGSEALFIYQLLSTSPIREMSLRALCNLSQLNLSQTTNALELLYQVQLIDLKVSTSSQRVIRLQFLQALSFNEVLAHDVLGRALLKKCGADCFENLREMYSTQPLSEENYEEYQVDTKAFSNQQWSEKEESLFQKKTEIKHDPKTLSFDLVGFLNQCSTLSFPLDKRSEKSLAAIAEIGSVYGLSVKDMEMIVGKAYVENDPQLDIEKVRKLAAKVEVEESEHFDDPYEYPPALFLRRLRKGIEPTSLEKYLLVKLVSKDGLKPVVLNVLLESHFNQYHSKINTKVLEEIALQWAVQNVRTKEEAFDKVQSFKAKGRRVEAKTEYHSQTENLSDAELKAIEIALKEIK